MPSSVKVGDEAKWVEVIHHGTLTLERLVGVRAAAADLMTRTNLSRLLVDSRDADVSALGTTDAYEFHSSHAAVLPFAGRLRVAIVVAPEQLDQSAFGENVARNRGVNLRVFADADEAREWLMRED